jgi:hypothetical protein
MAIMKIMRAVKKQPQTRLEVDQQRKFQSLINCVSHFELQLMNSLFWRIAVIIIIVHTEGSTQRCPRTDLRVNTI